MILLVQDKSYIGRTAKMYDGLLACRDRSPHSLLLRATTG